MRREDRTDGVAQLRLVWADTVCRDVVNADRTLVGLQRTKAQRIYSYAEPGAILSMLTSLCQMQSDVWSASSGLTLFGCGNAAGSSAVNTLFSRSYAGAITQRTNRFARDW